MRMSVLPRSLRVALVPAGLLCLALLAGCEDSEWYVDGRTTGLQLGTVERPFRTIGEAIGRAGPGDVIHVAPGLYRENLRVGPGVALVSSRTGAAILHGRAEPGGGWPTVVVDNGARLSGFTVTGGYIGVLCEAGAPVIERNIIRGNHGGTGLSLLEGCDAHVLNNTILGQLGDPLRDTSRGIYVERARPTLRNNIVTGNDVGLLAYQARPVEIHNLFWNNRQNLGEGLAPGEGTLQVDPMFRDATVDDLRLARRSPARDAGDPRWEFNDADGSRSDIGAFDGDGGYQVGLPAQQYFVESVLGAIDREDGLQLDGASRLQQDLLFWFDGSGRNTVGAFDVWTAISRAVPVLTAGRYRARLHNASTPPFLRCRVVTVSFGSFPRGEAYYQDAAGGCRNPDNASRRAGAPIVGGELHVGSWQQGIADHPEAVATLEHELGHVLGLRHVFRGDTIMGQPHALEPGFKETERAAFELLYRHPPGTTFERLLQTGELTADVLYPFPRVDGIERWSAETGRWQGGTWQGSALPRSQDAWARRGDYLMLAGSRLTLRWLTERRITVLPADHAPPQVLFGGRLFTVDLDGQNCGEASPASACEPDEPTNDREGRPARFLKWQVPDDARSGWLVLKARGMASNPVWLEIR
jgi:hypothetical protein